MIRTAAVPRSLKSNNEETAGYTACRDISVKSHFVLAITECGAFIAYSERSYLLISDVRGS